MNSGQLNSLASLFAGDPNMTRFTATQYRDASNRAQEQFVFDSKCLFKETTFTLADGTAGYDLPADFLWDLRCSHKGLRLEPVSRETLEFYRRTDRWDDDEGTPKYYIIDPEEARKQITFAPIPQGDDAGANTILTYVAKPTELDSDDDEPLNGYDFLVPYHIGIAAYQAWILLGYEEARPEVMAKRGQLYKIYQDKVTEATDRFKNTPSEPLRMRGGRAW